MIHLFIVLLALSVNACSNLYSYKKADIKLVASTKLNPDINARPSPLLLNFYELKSNIPFKSLNFTKLSYQSYNNLNSSLIDTSEIEIRPSEVKRIIKKLHKETNYLGVVASYRELEKSKWKQIISVPNLAKTIRLKLLLGPQSINYQQEY